MNDFLQFVFWDNSTEQWLISLAIIISFLIGSRLFYLLSTRVIKKLAARSKNRLPHLLVDMIEEPLAVLIVIAGFWYGLGRLKLGDSTTFNLGRVELFAVILTLTWGLARVFKTLINQFVKPLVEKTESTLDDLFLPILSQAGKVVIWAIGSVIALENVGYNVGAVLAGLGIGGLAFALAAQETIANIFGGITIFLDSPFGLNDRIKVAGVDGWVRQIGIRCSRLETLEGRMVTVPNAIFAKSIIENISSEPAVKISQDLDLSPQSNADQLEKALTLLGEIVVAEPLVEDRSLVFVQNLSSSGIRISFTYWIKKEADFAAARNAINAALLRRFSQAGLSLAQATLLPLLGK